MKRVERVRWWLCGCFCLLHSASCLSAPAFEGSINVTVTQGGQSNALLYTADTNWLRVESAETSLPTTRNIVNLQTGEITLIFPRNRSFVRLKSAGQNNGELVPRAPGAGIPGDASRMPAIPMTPAPGEKMELHPTGQTTNLLGCACTGYEIKQRGETMRIWATDQLPPFQPWMQNQPHRLGPRMLEEQWGELLKAHKLFPLLAALSPDNGPERFHFEVTLISTNKIAEPDEKLFLPPGDYNEIRPLPF